MDERLYTTQEATSQPGVIDLHIRNIIATGQAKPIKQIGDILMFTQSELERILARPKSKGGCSKKHRNEAGDQ